MQLGPEASSSMIYLLVLTQQKTSCWPCLHSLLDLLSLLNLHQIDFEGQPTAGNLKLVEDGPPSKEGVASVNIFRMKSTSEVREDIVHFMPHPMSGMGCSVLCLSLFTVWGADTLYGGLTHLNFRELKSLFDWTRTLTVVQIYSLPLDSLRQATQVNGIGALDMPPTSCEL